MMMKAQNGVESRILFAAVLLCSIIGSLTGVVAAVSVDAYDFPAYSCGNIIQSNDPLAQVRQNILINVVTVHSAASHRVEFTTCINAATTDGRTMYAAAFCTDPTSDACDQCLREAQAFEDHNCLNFDKGHAIASNQACTIAFGTYPDVCNGVF